MSASWGSWKAGDVGMADDKIYHVVRLPCGREELMRLRQVHARVTDPSTEIKAHPRSFLMLRMVKIGGVEEVEFDL